MPKNSKDPLRDPKNKEELFNLLSTKVAAAQYGPEKTVVITSGKHRNILESIKDPLLTIILCAPNEKQDKGNLGQKGL